MRALAQCSISARVVAPPRTPASVVTKLNAAVNDVLRAPETADYFRSLNMEPVGGTPAEVRQFIKGETERWGEVIRAANITSD